MKEALKCRNDIVKNVKEKLITVNLGEGNLERLVKISKNLLDEEKRELIALLKEFRDIFAWWYEEMLGLDPMLVTHKFNVDVKV